MKTKKWFSFALALMMLVSLSAGIAGGTAYAADAEVNEDFESYAEGESPEAFAGIWSVNKPDENGKRSSYKIATETTAEGETNQYLDLGTSTAAVTLQIPIPDGLDIDLYSDEEDSVYALEFDFTSNGYTGSSKRLVSLAYTSNTYTEFGNMSGKAYYCANEITDVDSSDLTKRAYKSIVDTSEKAWHRFKIIYRTKDRQYDVFCDDKFVATTFYRTGTYYSAETGRRDRIQLYCEAEKDKGITMGIDNVKLYKTEIPTTDAGETFESYEVGKSPEAFYYQSANKPDATTGVSDAYRIASEKNAAGEVINKYLDVGTTTLNSGRTVIVGVPIPDGFNMNLQSKDSVYVLDFDFTSKGYNGSATRLVSAYSPNWLTEFYHIKDSAWYGMNTTTDATSSSDHDYKIFASSTGNAWHNVKIIYRTKDRVYDILWDGKFMARSHYRTGSYKAAADANQTKIYFSCDPDTAGGITMGIDNVKLYKTGGDFAYYVSPKLWSDYDDNPVDVTAGFTAGTITAEADIYNMTENEVPVTLIAALYNGTTLEKVSLVSDSYGAGTIDVPAKIHTNLDVTATDGRTLKVFLWDGVSKLIPLAKAAGFVPADE